MASGFESPWKATLNGPWSERIARSQKPCRYCRRPAAMKEPGSTGYAHKVCAESDADGKPLGDWDGEDRKAASPRPLGCGPHPEGATSGRFCGRTGAQLSCKLCPESPTYGGEGHVQQETLPE